MNKRLILILISIALCFFVVSGFTRAESMGGGYELSWYTLDGGGTMPGGRTGGSYSLGGTIGQPDAGTLSGGGYTLNGGFWGGAALNYSIYLPLVVKG